MEGGYETHYLHPASVARHLCIGVAGWPGIYVLVLLGAPRRNEIVLSLLDRHGAGQDHGSALRCGGHNWCLDDQRATNTQAGSFVVPLLE